GLYRLPRTMATDVLVLERVVGSLSRIQKAKSILMKTDSHVESGAGGVGTRGPTKEAQAQTLDKMPAHFHAYWDQTNTSQAEREKEAALYWKRQQTRAMNQ
ncbi:MAG: hypothetical protein ACRD5H_01535, partial [Nitrososphaerales archaeon]